MIHFLMLGIARGSSTTKVVVELVFCTAVSTTGQSMSGQAVLGSGSPLPTAVPTAWYCMVAVLLMVDPTSVELLIWKGMRMIAVPPTASTLLFPLNVYIPPLLVVVQPAGTIGAPNSVIPGILR